MQKKTIVLVADVKSWAFDNIAQYLLKLLGNKYDIHIIYVSNFRDYETFLDALHTIPKVQLIHFFYRIYLRDLITYFTRNDLFNPKLKIFSDAAIVTVIPDKMFLKEDDIESNEGVFFFLDNYYTVSEELYKIYSDINIYPKPYGVIYDNIIVQSEANFVSKEKLEITWIGNSAWGAAYFGPNYDSKGFKTLVKPVLEKIKEELGFGINIADAASEKRSTEEVKEILEKTDILLIGAKGEGTPLPLIEAMASGCAVISSNVGIVQEVLPETQKEFIIKRDIDSFIEAILHLNKDRELLTKLKKDNYEAYDKIFLNSEEFLNKWSSFIEDSINRSKNRKNYRNDFLTVTLIYDMHRFNHKIQCVFVTKIMRFVIQCSFARKILAHLYYIVMKTLYKTKCAITLLYSCIARYYKKLFVSEEEVFSNIYATDFWTNGSGPGSAKEHTVEYREILQRYFNDTKYQTYVDLGCGDWQIMSLIKIPKEKTYTGYDIVKTVIDNNKKKFSKNNVSFYHTREIDDIEAGDLLIVKDVLMHWPNKKVEYFIDHILPKFKYALITEGDDPIIKNKNINFGEWRPVDLTSSPFNASDIEHIYTYEAHGGVKKIYFYTNPIYNT